MLDYEKTLQTNLKTIEEMATLYFGEAGRDYPEMSFDLEVLHSPEELDRLHWAFSQAYYETVQNHSRCRWQLDKSQQIVNQIERQSREERKLGGLISNYAGEYKIQIERLKNAWYALGDRRDHLYAMVQIVKTGFLNLRPTM